MSNISQIKTQEHAQKNISAKFFSLLLCALLIACAPKEQLNSNSQDQVPVVKVVTSGGFAAAYDNLIPQIERDLGIKLHTEYGSSSGGAIDSIPMRLANGEDFDVIILSRGSLDNLTQNGFVINSSRIDLVRSQIGMAVQEGSVLPDISSVELFVQALMDADSIGYSASASGTYLSTTLFPEMGIWETLQPKSVRILSERVASVVARGEVDIGFQQISEILPIAGAAFVGPIPDELQRVTTFSAGILIDANNPEAASRLLDYLSSENIAPAISASGLSPVVLEGTN
ncbi:MAG: substrate-binding domain-containing protein [Gammaproteobacteria bacterium]|nr:substrate-binding domain-containing protein [Gammaproteobacteria bacterium]